MWKKIQEEPVLVQGLAQAALALGISFGLPLSSDQVGAILAVTAALLAFWARTQVTPLANPKASDGTPLLKTI